MVSITDLFLFGELNQGVDLFSRIFLFFGREWKRDESRFGIFEKRRGKAIPCCQLSEALRIAKSSGTLDIFVEARSPRRVRDKMMNCKVMPRCGARTFLSALVRRAFLPTGMSALR